MGVATAVNLGTGGSALNAVYGSSTGANSNQPLRLERGDENYLYLPGVTNANFAYTLPSAPLEVTGNLELVARVKLNYAALAVQSLSNRDAWNWFFYNGIMYLSVRTAIGYSFNTALSSSLPFVAGTTYWVRMRRNSATGAVTYSYAPDQRDEPTTWTNLTTTGSQVAGALTYLGIENLLLGTTDFTGNYYRHIVRNGFGGPTVFDVNFTTGITSGSQTTVTESSANAATVFIVRGTSDRKAVAVVQDVWLLGLDDYFEVADNALLDFGASENLNVVLVCRIWGATGTFMSLISKLDPYSFTNIGYSIFRDDNAPTTAFVARDGSGDAQTPYGQTYSSGGLSIYTAQRDNATIRNQRNTNTPTAAVAATGSLANSLPLRIGASSAGSMLYAQIECMGAAVFRRALSQAEIAEITNYYAARFV